MKRLLIAGIAAAATFAIVVPAASADSGFCAKRSLDGDRVTCVASASEDHAR